MTHSSILSYAIYGNVHTASLRDFESLVAADKTLHTVKPGHDNTLMLYYDEPLDPARQVSKAVFAFMQKLFNSDTLPAEIADYTEITADKAAEHMKKDSHVSFAWTIAVDGKLYGSQIYLV